MSKEIWKDVPGFNGMYHVSDLGRVKSLKRTVKHGRNKEISLRETILAQINLNTGYLGVNLYKNGKRFRFFVHQLMAMAFLGHKINGHTMVVDHIDEDRNNNVLSNIRIIPHRENFSRGYRNKTSKYVGVHKHKASGKWISKIGHNKKYYHLGSFESELDAHLAYQKKKIELLCQN